jgi:FMN phosphatase YigB (HAD superfamily)
MTAQIDVEQARREELRWLLLLGLNSAQPMGTSEVVLSRAVEPMIPDVTQDEIRRALDYLAQRELVAVSNTDKPAWFAKINRHGIDVVEYTVECLPGIARPKKW